MTIKDTAGRVAVLATLAERINDQLKLAKQDLAGELATAHQEHGTKQIGAALPDGATVAKVSWVTPGAQAVVVDDAAFLAWVVKNRPDQVERRFVTDVREAYTKALLKELTAAGVTQWCDPETGELHDVPGVKIQGRAAYQRLTFEESGQQRVIDAWRAGDLLGQVMPELEGGE